MSFKVEQLEEKNMVKLVIEASAEEFEAGLNAAYNKNKILKLPDNGLERNRQNAFQVYDPQTKKLIWVGGYQEGQEPGALYAFKH